MDEHLADIWNARALDYAEGEFVDFDKLISLTVSGCLTDDEDNRAEIAYLLSLILGERVSMMMLNAYASEALRGPRIPASCFLVLIAATWRFDILYPVLREVSGKALGSQRCASLLLDRRIWTVSTPRGGSVKPRPGFSNRHPDLCKLDATPLGREPINCD